MVDNVESQLDKEEMEKRLTTLNEFSSSISSSSDTLDDILQQVGWTRESLQEGERLVTCPINSNHYVPESSLSDHVKRCDWARDGYTRQEQEEAESNQSNQFFYTNASGVISVTLDDESLKEVLARFPGMSKKGIPRTVDRLDKEFSPEQRLAIYEHVKAKCKEVKPADDPMKHLDYGLEIGQDKDDNIDKPKSKLEVLAEMRDYRRRRQSYRAKNVHITKKTRTDVMREIIDAHMQTLEESYKVHQERKTEDDDKHGRRDRSTSRNSREESSMQESRGRHHRSNSRERSRDWSDRSRSSSQSRDGTSHHRSRHKHKHKHKSKSHYDDYDN